MIILIFNALQRSSSSTTASQGSGEGGSSSKAAQPQTLEELLERQWEQGSQFLMEQASHFDSKLISRVFSLLKKIYLLFRRTKKERIYPSNYTKS